ncbi:DUF2871 family protein [Ectobacillus polymachus]|uniref:DUF2871 family protein n=1 Tax=Ectobacillus polymachus TaxID=1508806 RepID=UPI003A8B66D5
MKKLLNTAFIYAILGLVAGLYYRQMTVNYNFTGKTMLSLLHTHIFVLGMFMFLFVLLLEKNFSLTKSDLFNWFYYIYNAGLIITVGLMGVHGTLTVMGITTGAAIAGIAGIGHIIISIGFILFFLCLNDRVKAAAKEAKE